MKNDTKYLKSGGGNDDDGQDDQEQNTDMKLFNKKNQKRSFSHNKGFAGKSFARKRKRIS